MPIKPYRGTSRDRLTAIINAQNPSPRVEGVDFEYGPVESWAGPLDSNTRVTLYPLPQDSYIGPVPITYRRIPIGSILLLPPEERRPVSILELPTTTHAILDEINDAYGLNLDESEVSDIVYDTENSTIALSISETSYAWLTGTVNLPVDYIFDIDQFAGATLDGFQSKPIIDIDQFIDVALGGFSGAQLIGLEELEISNFMAFEGPLPYPTFGINYHLDGFYKDDVLHIVTELTGFSDVV